MKYFIIGFLIVCAQWLNAQSIDREKMDKYLDALAENDRLMGSVSIRQDDKEIYQKTFGWADVAKQKEPDAKTIYRIGSISKMFTAVMIFQLMEEGKLKQTTKLAKFFPAVPNADKITMVNLLNHHSGLANFTNDPTYLTWMENAKSKEEMLEIIEGLNTDFEPGTKGAYSNTNYVLLGYIVEEITKKSYAEALQERIVEKIGLNQTSYGDKIEVEKNEANSYTFESGSWSESTETAMSIPGGAGAVVSTPSDLTKFINALFAHKLIKEESLDLMESIEDGYGMGMFQFPFKTKLALGHNGGIDGFTSMLAHFEREGMSVALTANAVNYNFNSALIGVLSIAFGDDYELPTFESYDHADGELKRFEGLYASVQIPLKITISQESGNLKAQATGQASFPLEATSKERFQFLPAEVVIEFESVEEGDYQKFTLKQGGMEYNFEREE